MTKAKHKSNELWAGNVADTVKTLIHPDPPFSGIARSVIAFDNQWFRNFKIVTLKIEDNQVMEIQYSDPYANFECISRVELANELGIIHLNNHWAPGKTMQK